MGIVVPFRQKDAEQPRRRTKAQSRTGVEAVAGMGEILLFTGVRYERYDVAPKPAPRKRAPKRA